MNKRTINGINCKYGTHLECIFCCWWWATTFCFTLRRIIWMICKPYVITAFELQQKTSLRVHVMWHIGNAVQTKTKWNKCLHIIGKEVISSVKASTRKGILIIIISKCMLDSENGQLGEVQKTNGFSGTFFCVGASSRCIRKSRCVPELFNWPFSLSCTLMHGCIYKESILLKLTGFLL